MKILGVESKSLLEVINKLNPKLTYITVSEENNPELIKWNTPKKVIAEFKKRAQEETISPDPVIGTYPKIEELPDGYLQVRTGIYTTYGPFETMDQAQKFIDERNAKESKRAQKDWTGSRVIFLDDYLEDNLNPVIGTHIGSIIKNNQTYYKIQWDNGIIGEYLPIDLYLLQEDDKFADKKQAQQNLQVGDRVEIVRDVYDHQFPGIVAAEAGEQGIISGISDDGVWIKTDNSGAVLARNESQLKKITSRKNISLVKGSIKYCQRFKSIPEADTIIFIAPEEELNKIGCKIVDLNELEKIVNNRKQKIADINVGDNVISAGGITGEVISIRSDSEGYTIAKIRANEKDSFGNFEQEFYCDYLEKTSKKIGQSFDAAEIEFNPGDDVQYIGNDNLPAHLFHNENVGTVIQKNDDDTYQVAFENVGDRNVLPNALLKIGSVAILEANGYRQATDEELAQNKCCGYCKNYELYEYSQQEYPGAYTWEFEERICSLAAQAVVTEGDFIDETDICNKFSPTSVAGSLNKLAPGSHIDEDKWAKAKSIVKKQYGDTEGNWGAVMDIYKNMGGRTKKDSRRKIALRVGDRVMLSEYGAEIEKDPNAQAMFPSNIHVGLSGVIEKDYDEDFERYHWGVRWSGEDELYWYDSDMLEPDVDTTGKPVEANKVLSFKNLSRRRRMRREGQEDIQDRDRVYVHINGDTLSDCEFEGTYNGKTGEIRIDKLLKGFEVGGDWEHWQVGDMIVIDPELDTVHKISMRRRSQTITAPRIDFPEINSEPVPASLYTPRMVDPDTLSVQDCPAYHPGYVDLRYCTKYCCYFVEESEDEFGKFVIDSFPIHSQGLERYIARPDIPYQDYITHP